MNTSGLPQSIAKTANSKGFITTTEKVISESVPFNIVAYPNHRLATLQLLMEEVMREVVKVYAFLVGWTKQVFKVPTVEYMGSRST
jgi:hypothetical protein